MKHVCAMVVAAILLPAGLARADGFGEVLAGIAAPMSDDDYDNAVDASFKLGVRVGAMSSSEVAGKAGLGFELGVDWTPLTSDIDVFDKESFHRVRFLAGARLVYAVTDKVSAMARFAAGVDYTHATVGGTAFGVEFESTEDDIGFALDPSFAVLGTFGSTVAGLQIGFPIGIHDEQGMNFNIDYTSVDLDVLFVVGSRM